MSKPELAKAFEALDSAQAIASLDPMPSDAVERIEALAKSAPPEMAGMFGDFISAALLQLDLQRAG